MVSSFRRIPTCLEMYLNYKLNHLHTQNNAANFTASSNRVYVLCRFLIINSHQSLILHHNEKGKNGPQPTANK